MSTNVAVKFTTVTRRRRAVSMSQELTRAAVYEASLLRPAAGLATVRS